MIVFSPIQLVENGFWFMMIGRVMEAFAVGVLFPSYQSVLLEITPKDERGTTMGIAGLVMGSALACGPIVSGIILRFFNWKALFIFFMIVITIIIIFAQIGLIRDVMARHETHLDWLSVFLLLGLVGLMEVIDQIGKKNVNWLLNGVILIVSLIMLAVFIGRQFKLTTPLLELRVLFTFNYDLAILLTSISYIALIVTTIIFPLYYQGILHVSPFVSGMALVPGSVFLSILNPLTGKLADKIGFKPTMLLGMAMIILGWVIGTFSLTKLNLAIMIFAAMIIEGGNAFVMMPAVTLGANALPNHLVPHGTAVITTIRQVLGSTGVAVSTVILTSVSQAALSEGVSLQLASLRGYHLVFSAMIGIEIIGLLLAFLIQNNQKQ